MLSMTIQDLKSNIHFVSFEMRASLFISLNGVNAAPCEARTQLLNLSKPNIHKGMVMV